MANEIVTCGCNDTDKFAKDAFKILFPDTDIPPLSQHQSISQNPEICEFVKALEKSNKPYAYYFKEENDNIEAWDLLKGVRVR